MKLSIVTVVRNDPRVVEALASVRAQHCGAEVECIVVDGASTDGTLAALEASGLRVDRLISEPDGGLYDAMNKGIALATGEVVGTLNADDRYASDTVLASVAAAFEDPGILAAYGDLAYLTPAGRVLRRWGSRPFQAGDFARGWMPPHPTFFVRREVYGRWGGFDTGFRIAADFELMLRFLEVHRVPSRHVPEVWIHMRSGGVSNRSPGNIWRANRECLRALRKHGLPAPWTFIPRKILSKLPQFLG